MYEVNKLISVARIKKRLKRLNEESNHIQIVCFQGTEYGHVADTSVFL